MNIKNIKYTLNHKKAFLNTEKHILGKNTITGYLHDIDKLFLYLLPFEKNFIQRIHRKLSNHHIESIRKKNYLEMVIDWESARYTKPDKQLNARETLYKYYPLLKNEILPILKKYNL